MLTKVRISEQPPPQKNRQKKKISRPAASQSRHPGSYHCHVLPSPSTLSDRGDASTDFEITVGNVKYLLIENQEVNKFLLLVFHLALCSQLSSSDGHIMLFK